MAAKNQSDGGAQQRVLSNPADKYLLAAEVAAILRMSTDRLYRMRRDGSGPPCKPLGVGKGCVVLYPRAAFEKWCQQFEAGEIELQPRGRPSKAEAMSA